MIITEYPVPSSLGIHTLSLRKQSTILAGGIKGGAVYVLVAEDLSERDWVGVDVALYPDGEDIGVKQLKGKYLDTVVWWGADGPAHLFDLS